MYSTCWEIFFEAKFKVLLTESVGLNLEVQEETNKNALYPIQIRGTL